MFRTYPSNVRSGTGHNFMLCWDTPKRLTARAYLRVQSHKPDTWRFWFSNAVDSTYASGEIGYPDRPGGAWKILSARIGDGGAYIQAPMTSPAPVTGWVPVTFDGASSRDVAPSETFWSDEVSFVLPEDHLLVWEWEIEGSEIPCTPDSQAPTFVRYEGEELTFRLECPMPDLFGARRDVKNRVIFVGDSITQGCGTRNNFYENWAARIAAGLGEDYSCWNIGLGWARASDMACGEVWKYKAIQGDTVCLALGVNDIGSGKFRRGRADHADEIIASIEAIVKYLQKHGVRVILFTIAPFDYTPEMYMVWKTLRYAYPALAKELSVELFDFSGALDARPPYGNRFIHGAHPDGEGGRVAAEAFLSSGFFD